MPPSLGRLGGSGPLTGSLVLALATAWAPGPWLAAAKGAPAAALSPAGLPAATDLQEGAQRFHPVVSGGGLVAAQEARAAAVGASMLRQGGNAVDAAVATCFALAVTLPQAGNLGGGGFLVLWLPQSAAKQSLAPAVPIGRGQAVALNFRETAPLAVRPELFLQADGSVDRAKATRSLLSTGVPGTVAGLTLAQGRYGRLPLKAVMAPAIELAERGFPVGVELAASLAAAAPLLKADPTSRRQFFKPGGQFYRPGEILRQADLARSLRRIAEQGAPGFYGGPVARALEGLMAQRGGLIRSADLAAYRARWQAPLQGRFRGYQVVTMPPPSGGGITLLQLLNVLEPLDLPATGANSAATIHRLVEAMNLAYRDRNRLLGDPDQVAMPLEQLQSSAYATLQRSRLDLQRHRPASQLEADPTALGGSSNTTHVSVADRQGGLVAVTTTLNGAYGNGISVPGAGFLLNNELDDFSLKPGSANGYGLVQGAVNAIAPGRRPLSSMSPTLVFRPSGEPLLATGSPGGSRIITTVLQVLLNRLAFGLNLASSVAAPRIHSQLWPDQISIEEGLSPDTRRLLEAMGHKLVAVPAMGSANSVEVLPAKDAPAGPGVVSRRALSGGSLGVADPRRRDAAAVPE
ncbi:MAG: gamma-glutamyltransferase [Cyanobacteria bacterium]|nr:gamma-glutamyltransferase [Cyanobacteriota bacterium]